MLGGGLPQRAGRELRERAAGVTQEGDDGRLALEEPGLRQLPDRLAGLGWSGGGEREGRQEGAQVHGDRMLEPLL